MGRRVTTKRFHHTPVLLSAAPTDNRQGICRLFVVKHSQRAVLPWIFVGKQMFGKSAGKITDIFTFNFDSRDSRFS